MKLFYTALCLLITVIAHAQTGKVPMRKSDPPPGASIIQPQQLSQAKGQVPIKAGDAQANSNLSRMAVLNNKVPVQTGGAQTSNTNRRAAVAAPQGNSKGPSSQDIPVSRPASKAVVPPVIEQQGTPPPTIQPFKTITGIKKAVKN